MFLREISLQNFKAFRGQHRIDLPLPTKQANVYLFGGQNGAGKTSLMQAVLLALYGVGAAGMPGMPTGGRDIRRKYETWLEACRNTRARDNQDDLVSVGVIFEDNGVTITVQRSIWYRADGHMDEELLEVREDVSRTTDLYSSAEAQERVAVWMPRHLAELIFFDGEQVRTQLGDETGSISDALDRLLDLEPITKLVSDIKRLSRDKRAAVLSEGQFSALESLERQFISLDHHYQNLLIQQGESRRARLEIQDELAHVKATLNERLSGTSPTTSAQLDGELAGHRQRRNELRARLGKNLGDWLYLAFEPELLQEVLGVVSNQRQLRRGQERFKVAEEATSSFSEALLKELSKALPEKSLKVVRGVTLDLRAAKGTLADEMGTSASAALEGLCDEELVHAQQAAESMLRHDLEEVGFLASDLADIQANLDRLECLQATFGTHGHLDNLLARVAELQDSLSEADGRLSRLDADLNEIKDRTVDLRKSVGRLTTRAQDSAEVTLWLDAADSLSEALLMYIKERRALAIASVERALRLRLKELLHKQHLVKAVEIDPITYAVRITGSAGRPLALPSAGEHQLAAMAFSAAILDCSESSVPTFVDTPLARLDASHRHNVAARFWPKAGRQVFVFSTDEEVRGRVLETLRPHIVQSYAVIHDDEQLESSVLPGRYLEGIVDK